MAAMRARLERRWHAIRAVISLTWALDRSVVFDRESYEAQRGRNFPTRVQSALDYVLVGSRAGMAAGPLLISPTSGVDRPAGVGAAGFWASLQLDAGFPNVTRHPLADLEWYAEHVPESAGWRGGALGHYTQVGRAAKAQLGPLHSGDVDLVDAGMEILRSGDALEGWTPASGQLGDAVVGLVAADPRTEPATTVAAFLDGYADRVAVVPSDNAQGEERLTAFAVAQTDPRVHITADADVASATANCTAALVGTAHLNVTPGSYAGLLDAVHAGAATVAAPVILEVDDTVREAGRDDSGVHRFAGLPWADATRGGDAKVAGASGVLVAMSPAAIAQYVSLGSLRRSIEATVETVAASSHSVTVLASAAASLVPLSLDATRKRPPAVEPVRTGKLRWAIKSPHPAGPRRETWGDWHFAKGLASALESLGHEVAIDPFHSWNRPSAQYDDVTITIRGLRRFRPQAEQVNVLWVISHPELIEDDELEDFDVVAAASIPWSDRHSVEGREVLALLQCTNADLFHPGDAQPGTGYELLFVGNSRSAARPLIDAAGTTRPELRIIGGGWHDRMPPGVVVAEHVANQELPALYRAAGVVLNDHWATMAADGFISNRLFDLTAAGARWISDDVPGLLDVLPTGRVASSPEELSLILDAGPAAFPSDAELIAASDTVRAEHSFLARAKQLSDVVLPLVTQRHR